MWYHYTSDIRLLMNYGHEVKLCKYCMLDIKYCCPEHCLPLWGDAILIGSNVLPSLVYRHHINVSSRLILYHTCMDCSSTDTGFLKRPDMMRNYVFLFMINVWLCSGYGRTYIWVDCRPNDTWYLRVFLHAVPWAIYSVRTSPSVELKDINIQISLQWLNKPWQNSLNLHIGWDNSIIS